MERLEVFIYEVGLSGVHESAGVELKGEDQSEEDSVDKSP